jgi:integrase
MAIQNKDREPKKLRGLFERPPGSGIWWINYYVEGKQHREKVGRRSDALALYQKRKADARRKLKLPELQPGKVVTFSHLMEDAVEYAQTNLKTAVDYEWKQRAVFDDFGSRPATEITPQEITRWLSDHCRTPATANRFKSFFSLCYRLGMENGKVPSNPARLVKTRREDNARLRFLSREEYDRLLGVVRRGHPRQTPAFIVSIYTGMRWSEQFNLTWCQVDLKRHSIRLTETKNGTARSVPLNSVALAALEEQRSLVDHKPEDPVFPEAGDYCRFWFEPSIAEAKIDNYTWHNNRHTFCSWLAMAGVSLKEIQVLAGHKTITMSARYAHLSPDAAPTASERLVHG